MPQSNTQSHLAQNQAANRKGDELYVIFQVAGKIYCVPSDMVREMLGVPAVSRVPNGPRHLRGVINLRGRVVPFFDLRMRLGLPSKPEETEAFMQMMRDREEDHLRWVAELEACLQEERDFTLTTDPHQCAFGKWYDAFTTEDLRVADVLHRFDGPHRRIHGIAKQVLDLGKSGRKKDALELIRETRHGALATMRVLFEEVRQTVKASQQEIALVLEAEGRFAALAVESVESVEPLQEGSRSERPSLNSGARDKLTAGLARRASDGEMVVLLDLAEILAPAA